MNLDELNDPKYIAFESFKKNGDAVNTPLWVVAADGNLYAWTAADSWKVKRVRNNPNVRVAVSDSSGTPQGEWVDAQAMIIDSPDEEVKMRQRLAKKYKLSYQLIRIFYWLRAPMTKTKATVIEIQAHKS